MVVDEVDFLGIVAEIGGSVHTSWVLVRIRNPCGLCRDCRSLALAQVGLSSGQ